MAGLKKIEGYQDEVINICPKDTAGEIIEIADLFIQLPAVPPKNEILYHDRSKEEQRWQRQDMPTELSRIGSMDEWYDMPKEFKAKYESYIRSEFERRNNGMWFFNNGEPTYLTGAHYMMLQWSKIDASFYGYYLQFREISITIWRLASLTLGVRDSCTLSVAVQVTPTSPLVRWTM